ncbi:MAG: hypothetical protein NW206_00855 [Hyphomonadaceae bacterium]|nr:hypothetical protein [Hyphomonadaceae bacterium]
MQHGLMAFAAFALLCACSQGAPTAQPVPQGPAAPFPDLNQTPFRATAAMVSAAGGSVPVIVLRDGRRTRLELRGPEGDVIRVTDREAGQTTFWRRQLGRAVLVEPAPGERPPADFPEFWWEEDGLAAEMRLVGACALLDENGSEWARQNDPSGRSICVTTDGVVLWAADRGATVWHLTSLQRGPQELSEFGPPSGARSEGPEPAVEERDLNAAYVPPPQFSTPSDTPAPQNR